MTPGQCRAARKLLGWSLLKIASRSKIYPDSIFLYEKGEQPLSFQEITALRRVYEAAGVRFEVDGSVSLPPPEQDRGLTPEQCRTARTLLGWGTRELSWRCKVKSAIITSWEQGEHPDVETMIAKVQRALEAGGVEFVTENGVPGVRLRSDRGHT